MHLICSAIRKSYSHSPGNWTEEAEPLSKTLRPNYTQVRVVQHTALEESIYGTKSPK